MNLDEYKKIKKKHKKIYKKSKNKKYKNKKNCDYSSKLYEDLPYYYTDKKTGKVFINRIILKSSDKYLLENFPDKYSVAYHDNNQTDDINDMLHKSSDMYEKRKKKEFESLLDEYDKYQDNPKKYHKKGGCSKQEREIMKYLSKIAKSEHGKKDKMINKVLKDIKKCNNMLELEMLINQYESLQKILNAGKHKRKHKNKYHNSGYLFSKEKYKDLSDKNEISLISALDDEINKRLMEENLFLPNNICTDYNDYKNTKKKKKKLSIEDIII